ncbi:hypothetical protein RND81_08G131400 [Saponaria officinalis]|uniref:Uncharacterized protein n=1 Tax=Saponaria officinalis TaxID=3572 RepID=A0AAW1J6Q0_SAPOF
MDYLSFALCILTVCAALHLLWPAKKVGLSKLPPGPPIITILRNLLTLGTNPHVTFANLARDYGPLIALRGPTTTVIVSSAAVAKEVLQKNDLSFSNRSIIDSVRADNYHHNSVIWLPVSPKWRNLRKMCNTHVFSSARLDATQNLRRNQVQNLISYLKKCSEDGIAVDIRQAAFNTMVNLLSTILFSVDLDELFPNSKVSSDFKDALRGILDEAGKPNLSDFFPILRKMDPQGIRRRTGARFQKIIDLFNTVIKRRLEGERPPGLEQGNDFLDALLGNSQEKTPDIESSNIPYLFLDLFSAGTDTISSTVEWAMAELLHNPEKLTRAKAEMNKIIGKGNPFQESHIGELPYLQGVLKETFRLHPSAPFLVPREADKNVELLGFTVPKNAQILVNAWEIGRDPEIWERPNWFEPERFLGSGVEVKGCDFELIPFGSGRRMCVGMPLAIRMVHLMVGSLVHGFEWKLEGGVLGEKMNMEEKLSFALQKAQPLRVFPLRI